MSSRTGVHDVDAMRVDVATLLTIEDGVGRGVLDGVSLAIGCWSQYLPPVFVRLKASFHPTQSFRCQSILPCDRLGQQGALMVLVAVQLFSARIVSRARIQRC